MAKSLSDRIAKLEELSGRGKPQLVWLEPGEPPPPDAPAGTLFVQWSDVSTEPSLAVTGSS